MAIIAEDMDPNDELFIEMSEIFGDLINIGPPFDEFLTEDDPRDTVLDVLDSIDGATRQEVIDAAADVRNALVANLTETRLRSIVQIVADGLEKQQGVDGIARRLRTQIDLRPDQVRALTKYSDELIAKGKGGDELERLIDAREDKLIRERATLIARTETRNAVEAGELAAARDGGATHHGWMLGPNPCELCIGNAAQGVIPIDEPFDSGDFTAPAHPNCMCTTYYVTDTGGGELDRAQARAETRNEARRNGSEPDE